jgi:outer membrane protein assembly factor BamE
MFFYRLFSFCSIILFTLNLAGCTFPPRLYKPDIRQGNCISEQMISQLKRGMTKAQVQEVLGTPVLNHCLNTDRWDYYYYFKPGMGNGPTVEKHFTVFFKNDRVAGWE